jgi:hypothetical protein
MFPRVIFREPGSRSERPSSARARSAVAALVFAMFAPAVVQGASRPASAESPSGLELLGRLAHAKGGNYFSVVGIDPVNRRLYAKDTLQDYRERLVEYDLTTRIPKLRRDVPMPSTNPENSPNTWSFDPAGKRAFILEQTTSECPACSTIRILNLETLRLESLAWNLTLMVPNFYAAGITYSPADDRVYAIGSILGPAGPFADGITGLPTWPSMVVAIDAVSGSLAWTTPLQNCQHPAVAFFRGGAIYRSKRLNALYIPCIKPDPVAFDIGFYPGQSTLVRLWIDPHAGTADATRFRSETFPISGRYTGGSGVDATTAFDESADRIYMANHSTQFSGAWVFDGLLSAWAGFVPASDAANYGLGLNQATGHMYMRSGNDSQIIVSDGRATPVPQGEAFPVSTLAATDFYLADPLTGRVFVRATNRVPRDHHEIQVLLDHTPSARPLEPVDYDGLTMDVAEGPGTLATFAGSANGFGTRMTLVGGYAGALSPVIQTTHEDPVRLTGLGISPGPRGVILGNVASIDLADTGASSSAQAVAPDTVTLDEYDARRKDIGGTGGDTGNGVADALVWQWPAAVCLDAEGKMSSGSKESTVGRSSTTCDLKQARVTAASSVDAITFDAVSVARSSFDSTIVRAGGEGTVTESTALARGVEVALPGVGRLSIGRVKATVRTVAHGRPGTASVDWTREIDGVLLTDASGKVLFRCPEACSPQAVAAAVNENIGQRLRISVPDAEKVATLRGAFAGIKEARKDYIDGLVVNDDDSEAVPALELLLINDSADKSRLDVQLAAIQASSIYGISLLPTEGGLSAPPLISVPPLVPPEIGPGPQVGPGAIPPPFGTGRPTLATTRSSVFAVRSAADALFISLICVLVFATIAGAVRRHRFAALLNGGSQG